MPEQAIKSEACMHDPNKAERRGQGWEWGLGGRKKKKEEEEAGRKEQGGGGYCVRG